MTAPDVKVKASGTVTPGNRRSRLVAKLKGFRNRLQARRR